MHETGTVYQLAFLVPDLDAAAAYWQRCGAGPFYCFDDFEFTEVLHPRGAASPRLSILLGYSGDTMIELIKVQEDATGVFSGAPPSAVHHVALLVDDIGAYLAEGGQEDRLVLHGLFPTGTPIAMLDTRAETGVMTELVTLDAAVEGMIEQMRREAFGFTGDDLLRTFS